MTPQNRPIALSPHHTEAGIWLAVIRRYLLASALGNLVWETAQLPFYRIWYHAPLKTLLVIVGVGVSGDIIIATMALTASLCMSAPCNWPAVGWQRVAALTVLIGFGYTLASEYVHLRLGTWHYASIMPRLPIIGVGLLLAMEWVVVPIIALSWSKSVTRKTDPWLRSPDVH